MTEFSTSAAVDIVVDDRSLRDARDTIEDGLGDLAVDVTGSTAPSAADRAVADGGVGATGAATLAIQREQNERLGEIVELLEDGGGGGEGGSSAARVGATGAALRVLGGIGAGSTASSVGTAAGVGGVVGGGIAATALIADLLADTQQNVDPIKSTTSEGEPAKQVQSATERLLNDSGLNTVLTNITDSLSNARRDEPVIDLEEILGLDDTDTQTSTVSKREKGIDPDMEDPTTPIASPEQTNPVSPQSRFPERRRRQVLGPDADRQTDRQQQRQTPRPPKLNSVRTDGVEQSLGGLERDLQRKFDELEREIDKIRRAFKP